MGDCKPPDAGLRDDDDTPDILNARMESADPLPLSPGQWQGTPSAPSPASQASQVADDTDDELAEAVLDLQTKVSTLEDEVGMYKSKLQRAEHEIIELQVWVNTFNHRLDTMNSNKKTTIKIEDDDEVQAPAPAPAPPPAEPVGRVSRARAKRAKVDV